MATFLNTPRKDSLVQAMVGRLVKQFQPEKIYLFGSRATKKVCDDSDYDLLMVVRGSQEPRYRREQKAFRSLCGVGAAKDILVFTREEFERKRKVVCCLPATVEREGILVYPG